MKHIVFALLALIVFSPAWADPPASQPTADLPWSQSVDGVRVALQVQPATWHAQDNKPFAIVLKLHVMNTSDKPIRVVDWRRQPAALLPAYDLGKLVEWGGGSRVLTDPAKRGSRRTGSRRTHSSTGKERPPCRSRSSG